MKHFLEFTSFVTLGVARDLPMLGEFLKGTIKDELQRKGVSGTFMLYDLTLREDLESIIRYKSRFIFEDAEEQ